MTTILVISTGLQLIITLGPAGRADRAASELLTVISATHGPGGLGTCTELRGLVPEQPVGQLLPARAAAPQGEKHFSMPTMCSLWCMSAKYKAAELC